MAKKRRRSSPVRHGALLVVRRAREAARRALESLRSEIASTRSRLDALVAEEERFRREIFGSAGPRAATKGAGRPARRRKGPPQAERFFAKLPKRFTLEDVRKLAGRKAGISLAQWSRAKRIRKAGKGYQKRG